MSNAGRRGAAAAMRLLLLGFALTFFRFAPEAVAQAPEAERVTPSERNAASTEAYPRIILQEGPALQGVAAWSHDDRFVVTENIVIKRVMVWDAKSGDLVNSIALPGSDSKEGSLSIDIRSAAIDDQDLLTLEGYLRDNDDGQTCGPGHLCLCTKVKLLMPLSRMGDWQILRGDGQSECDDMPMKGAIVISHDGEYVLDASNDAVAIKRKSGEVVTRLEKPEQMHAFGGALSPDGKRMALVFDVTQADQASVSQLTVFDLAVARVAAQHRIEGFYDKVQWLDDQRVILPGQATLILGAIDGQQRAPPIPFRCNTMALPGGAIVAIGTVNCFNAGYPGQGLERFDPARGWQPFGASGVAGTITDDLSVTPDGRALIMVGTPVSSYAPPPPGTAPTIVSSTVRAIDAKTGAMLAEIKVPVTSSNAFVKVSHAPDSKVVGLLIGGINHRWDMTNAMPVPLGETDMPVAMMTRETVSSDGQGWYERLGKFANGPIAFVSVAGGKRREQMLFGELMGEGKVPGSPLRWLVTPTEGIVLWQPHKPNASDSPEVVRVQMLEGNRFFAFTPEGRYDTDLGAESNALRWVVSDATLQSLASQTFMRNLYEPKLVSKLIPCHAAGNCAEVFPPISIGKLNRVLPEVKIVGVKRGAKPNQAMVKIEVRGGSMPEAPNGRTATAAYNLRLFRDGALVSQFPGLDADVDTSDLAVWRKRNLIAPGPDGARKVTLTVALPTGTEAKDIRFTAYAFNEDRVKSETARAEYAQPAVAKPRPRRAFVVTFGIDDYDDGKLSDLQFAGNDARLLGERLAQIPGYEVRRAIIARDPGSPKPAQITRTTIASVIAILQGVKVEAAKKALKQQGFDASQLEPPTPDDIVILAFSGHGWADKKGGFYLVPADAKWLADGEPDRSSLISAVQMADRLRDVDAGEMALIIDACHSAASVDAGGFKPGPMGDAGLGQLAFDKGIRILAATQADDVALEDPLLRQGLLTYALASEGITATGGKADGDGDGRITLDEWLVYATRRMPSLSTDARLGRLTTDATGARGWVSVGEDAVPPDVQEPALFDFAGEPSRIVLREGIGR